MSFSWREPARQPIIVAHRGSSALAPENTLAAFNQAMEDGADAIELDVQLCKGGELVVFHDFKLNRILGVKGLVKNYTLEELRKFSAGRWFSATYKQELVPTLEEVFKLVKGSIGINIELKSDGNISEGILLVKKCLFALKDYSQYSTVLFSSFNHDLVRLAKEKNPDILTAILVSPGHLFTQQPERLVREAGADFYFCIASLLTRNKIQRLQEHNIKVGVYTINAMNYHARLFTRNKIDVIFSNDPKRLRTQLPE